MWSNKELIFFLKSKKGPLSLEWACTIFDRKTPNFAQIGCFLPYNLLKIHPIFEFGLLRLWWNPRSLYQISRKSTPKGRHIYTYTMSMWEPPPPPGISPIGHSVLLHWIQTSLHFKTWNWLLIKVKRLVHPSHKMPGRLLILTALSKNSNWVENTSLFS